VKKPAQGNFKVLISLEYDRVDVVQPYVDVTEIHILIAVKLLTFYGVVAYDDVVSL
tara:strand:- start:7 stop:174 length:168 start_codon:yes stop_codon:yes gene_type:complete